MQTLNKQFISANSYRTTDLILNNSIYTALISDTPEKLSNGLAGFKELPKNHAMLFVFPDSKQRMFHTIGMNFPLDFVCMNQEGIIVTLIDNVTVGSIVVPMLVPCSYVAELNAGEINNSKISIGDKIKVPTVQVATILNEMLVKQDWGRYFEAPVDTGVTIISKPRKIEALKEWIEKNPISRTDLKPKKIREIVHREGKVFPREKKHINLFQAWMNNQYDTIDCPPGLKPKKLIDRIGRHTTRCIKPAKPTERLKSWPKKMTEKELRVFETKSRQEALRRTFGNIVDEYPNSWDFMRKKKEQLALDKFEITIEEVRLQTPFRAWEGETDSFAALNIQRSIVEIKEGNDKRFQDTFVNRKGYFPPKEFEENFIDYLKQSMEKEQTFLKKLIGKDVIRLYRGVNLKDLKEIEYGSTAIIDYPASSWSLFPHVSQEFGNVVIARDVPIGDIVTSIFGYLKYPNEGEFIVYTPEEGAEVEVVYIDRTKDD